MTSNYLTPIQSSEIDGVEYVYVPPDCSLSAFIDILYPGDTRRRHFKRLESFARYDIYSQVSKIPFADDTIYFNVVAAPVRHKILIFLFLSMF